MKAKKIFGLLAAGMMALPLLFGAMGAGNVVDAAEVPKDVSVTLHKRAFEDEFPEGYPKLNTGEIITDFGGTALPDVEFTVYDVTAKYHELASATGGTSQGAVNTIVADSTTSKPTYAASIVDGENTDTKGTTSATGEVKFGNLPLKKMVGGISKDAVYLFLETGAPANVKQYAQPIVLAMPIYTVATDGNPSVLNTDIHLYPKNVTMEDTKEITKIDSVTANYGDGETVNLEFGQTIEYQITINMPSHLAQLDSFTVTDIPADGLLLDMESITLSGDLSTDAPADYTLSKSGNGFKIDFNLNSTKVLALAGKQVTITYEMELTNEIAIDETAGNEVFVTINSDNEISFNGPEVSTGGYRFEKTDAHTGAGLAGAKFKVQRSATEFAKFTVGTNGWYEFDGWTTEVLATEIVSGTDGTFSVIGLKNGDYSLIETEAPSGYVELATAVPFTVTHGEFGDMDLETVPNTPKGLLPSTGGNGIFAFLAIGLGLMLGAFIWYKNSKKQAQV